MWRSLATWVVLLVGATAASADGPASAAWPLEAVHLKNGTVLRGLIVEDTPALVKFLDVRRQPGRPTVVFPTTFLRREIAKVDRLPVEERDRLKDRLHELEN